MQAAANVSDHAPHFKLFCAPSIPNSHLLIAPDLTSGQCPLRHETESVESSIPVDEYHLVVGREGFPRLTVLLAALIHILQVSVLAGSPFGLLQLGSRL